MEINSQLSNTSLYNLFDTSKERSLPTPNIQNTQNIQIHSQYPPQDEQSSSYEQKRETYGLLVLELMDKEEYGAFQRATAGMSEGEKMLAAQSLYSLTNFYNGKYNLEQNSTSKTTDLVEKNAQKAFGVEAQKFRHFLDRYKNAYKNPESVDIML